MTVLDWLLQISVFTMTFILNFESGIDQLTEFKKLFADDSKN